MDLSKLPKMGSTPPSPAATATSDPAAPMGSGVTSGSIGSGGPVDYAAAPVGYNDLVTEVVIAGVLGLIFLMLGGSFGGYLLSTLQGHVYDTSYTWPDGSPVRYFALEGGAGWLWFGEWILGVCLLAEAVVCGIGLITKRFGRRMGTLCLVLGSIGALANLVAIVMQFQAAYTQPIVSVVALAVGVVTALLHGRRVLV